MKKTVLTIACLFYLFTTQLSFSQTNYGPYKVYVSKKGDNPTVINEGSYDLSCDEGRVVDAQILEVNGPIKVDPMAFKLDGPPCPTYVNGKRIPKDPLPNTSATVKGIVKLDPTNIPEAGTTADANFKGQDKGYWTKCSKNEKVFSTDVRNVKYSIISIQIVLDKNEVQVCKDEKLKIKVNKRFPDNVGKITWASMNAKLEFSENDNDGCTIKGLEGGDDILTATFTVEKTTYVEKVKVKVTKQHLIISKHRLRSIHELQELYLAKIKKLNFYLRN
ncbi:MAG: hypothetical protein NTX03_01070 [Bacteroidetes bacterium]|nr:hypothetical protein [Bacteroidota bacterium]